MIVTEARSWIGTPYRHRASLKHVGCDCLGLVTGVWEALYGELPEEAPPYAPDWAEAGRGEPLAEAAARHLIQRPGSEIAAGDVLIFRWRPNVAAKHLAIATGPATMIHAHDGASVAEVGISPMWRRKLAYRFAFPGAAD
ncbi:NlpC/P60 family protein [Flaviflagellibacter deserti]|uniref:NlpC/P60 family protein n=1 Tax=Flaviflagellibacter deserti TaxID=2267266 RepID=A0ABV9Z118_9HYPH